jgi:hypothetical protein
MKSFYRPFKALVVGSSPTPTQNLLFDLESPLSRYGSHSAGGGAQSNEQFHTVVCCHLLLFFRVTLADLTFLAPAGYV